MTEENIFVCKLFFPLNISDFITDKNIIDISDPPPRKRSPPLSQQLPSKNSPLPSKTPLFGRRLNPPLFSLPSRKGRERGCTLC